ncbi:MAG: TIM barrel protein, partial [Victivallaceae bacterium]|nr:TIM barrel protein [Victivallaceae bacterium]
MLHPGVSISSITPNLNLQEVSLLADSAIATFECNPVTFARDFDHRIEREFQAMLTRTGKKLMSMHLPGYHEDDLSLPEESLRQWAVERQRIVIGQAAHLNCKIAVLHPSDAIEEGQSRTQRIARLHRSLHELEEDFHAAGMVCALENLPRTCLGNTPEEMMEILDGLDDRLFGVCLDVN